MIRVIGVYSKYIWGVVLRMKNKLLYDIVKILVEVAKNNEIITYKDVSKKLNNQVIPKNLGMPIGELSKIAHKLGLPLISVLVVNQETKIPGDGFYKLYSELKGVSESQAIKNCQQEIDNAHNCNKWDKLLNYFGFEDDKVKKSDETQGKKNKSKVWLVVHDIEAYNENCRLLGFSDKIYNAKNIKAKDIVVYYFSGTSTIKGIYEVCEKPWKRDIRWTSEHQISIKPILELENDIDFKVLVPNLALFKNKERWYGCIQGTNAIRELSEDDFKIIEQRVYKTFINNKELEYVNLLEDDLTIENESVEVIISKIKRKQQIVNKLKNKYNNCCQIERCNFTFLKKNGECYSEAHHINLLSEGGSQAESNVVILCSNHHRMFHYADIKIFDREGDRCKVIINGEQHYIKY